MRANELINRLKALPPETDVVLWRWNGKNHFVVDLMTTIGADEKKGFFTLCMNGGCNLTKQWDEVKRVKPIKGE